MKHHSALGETTMGAKDKQFFFDGQDLYQYPGHTSVTKWITSLTGVEHPEETSLLWYDDTQSVSVYTLSLEDLHLYATREAPNCIKSFYLTTEIETSELHNPAFFTNFEVFNVPESYDDFLSNLLNNRSLREVDFVDYHINQDLLDDYMRATEYSENSFPDSESEEESFKAVAGYVFEIDN